MFDNGVNGEVVHDVVNTLLAVKHNMPLLPPFDVSPCVVIGLKQCLSQRSRY